MKIRGDSIPQVSLNGPWRRRRLDSKNYVSRRLRFYRNAFMCQVVTTRLTARNREVNHELQTILTAG